MSRNGKEPDVYEKGAGCVILSFIAMIPIVVIVAICDTGGRTPEVGERVGTRIVPERGDVTSGTEGRVGSQYVTECAPVSFGEYSSATLDALGKLVRVGDTLRETLTSGDFVGDDGVFLDYWALHVCEDIQIDIEMTSNAVDAMLMLGRGWDTGAGFDLITYSDDYNDYNTDARIGTALSPGLYTIVATSYYPASGAYTLAIRQN